MNLAATFADVQAALGRHGIRVGVVGGVALASYGHPRMTLDLDLVVEAQFQDQVVAVMESLGYETLHRSTGYSNHLHSDAARGRVDVLYVRGATADQVFAGMRMRPGPGRTEVPVPAPEHLIAMKVHAIANAPARLWQEMADIAFLVRLDQVDRVLVRGYFEKANLLEQWRELETRL